MSFLEGWPARILAVVFAILVSACSRGSDSEEVTPVPLAPQITTAPTSQRVTLGRGVTFTVVATGSAPLHYQWHRNGTDVGGDSATYSLASVQFADAGDYTVTVTNPVSSVTSKAATLRVDPINRIDLPDGTALDLVSIPAGSFTMGWKYDLSGEATPHTVTLDAFCMAKFETTQAQWRAVMGNNPSAWADDPACPVEQVSYGDITAPGGFLDTLNAATAAVRPKGLIFRLPTEAEWEYACRAGTTTDTYWGPGDPIGNYAWYWNNGGGRTHAVGQKLPNAWGLHDMIGNVWEWCQDWYGSYPSDPQTDPAGPASGSTRTSRGASWASEGDSCNSHNRGGSNPDARGAFQGFRIVLASPRKADPCDRIDLPDGTALDLVSIPAGSFTMGWKYDLSGEATPHTVTLSGFYMAKFETTQAQWQAVMGNNPSKWSSPNDRTHPVEQVSYGDITAPGGFLDRLNAVTATVRPAGLVFRLPTEAEWEYACRAGTTTDTYWGPGEPIGNYAWYWNNSGEKTHAVGQKLSNAWGLYDMIGNVWEWCQDWYGSYPSDPQTDPAGPADGTTRTNRGASWASDGDYCSSHNRSGSSPDARGEFKGFRVVLAPPRTP